MTGTPSAWWTHPPSSDTAAHAPMRLPEASCLGRPDLYYSIECPAVRWVTASRPRERYVLFKLYFMIVAWRPPLTRSRS
jgi:hypothetical protein